MEVTCKDLLIKTLRSNPLQVKEAESSADVASWAGPGSGHVCLLPSHRGHFQACVISAFLLQQLRAQSRHEQANESISLCLAPNTARTQQAQSLVGFA